MLTFLERRRRLRRAGRRAHATYAAETKAWRKRNRRLFGTVTSIVTLVVVGSLLLAAPRSVVAWIGGAIAGMALAFLVALRESPPAWIENHLRGAWGEERTAKALEPLVRRGWHVLHDLRWDKGNFDHVIVGPAGIFVLDTKNWIGEARFSGGRLWVKRPSDRKGTEQQQLARAVRGQALQLHDWLSHRGAGRIWVNAVVVLWMDFEQQHAAASNVTFVHGDRLISWLDEQPPKWSPQQVSDLASFLQPGQRRRERRDYDLAAE